MGLSKLYIKYDEPMRITVMGGYQNGKSSMVNALLKDYYSLTGDGLATTKLAIRYKYGDNTSFFYRDSNYKLIKVTRDELFADYTIPKVAPNADFGAEITINDTYLKSAEFIDTPGTNADDSDTTAALRALNNTDYILYVVSNKALTIAEKSILSNICKRGIPFSMLMNCFSQGVLARTIPTNPQNIEIAREIEMQIDGGVLKPINEWKVFPCNLLWGTVSVLGENKLAKYNDTSVVLDECQWACNKAGIEYNFSQLSKISGIDAIMNKVSDEICAFDPARRIL